jgi:hypothetical protein
MNWKLEVEDVACAVDDMKTMDVFTFLCSEWDGAELGGEKKGPRYKLMGEWPSAHPYSTDEVATAIAVRSFLVLVFPLYACTSIQSPAPAPLKSPLLDKP